jgi:hypothetical protein
MSGIGLEAAKAVAIALGMDRTQPKTAAKARPND